MDRLYGFRKLAHASSVQRPVAPDSNSILCHWHACCTLTEPQHLPASQALGNATNRTDHLTTFRTRASYNFQETYGGTFAYFQTTGTTDPSLYAPAPITGSASGSPTSRGFITELAVVPFGKATSLWAPWLNVRLSLQYVAYLKFNGGHTNYDGFGRDARANNTLYLLSWFAF